MQQNLEKILKKGRKELQIEEEGGKTVKIEPYKAYPAGKKKSWMASCTSKQFLHPLTEGWYGRMNVFAFLLTSSSWCALPAQEQDGHYTPLWKRGWKKKEEREQSGNAKECKKGTGTTVIDLVNFYTPLLNTFSIKLISLLRKRPIVMYLWGGGGWRLLFSWFLPPDKWMTRLESFRHS